MFRYSTIVIVLTAFGCAATSTVPRVSKNPERPALERPATAPPPAAGDVLASPPAVLTLPDAVALALVRSPELSTYSWQVRADEARMIQAGLRPNPEARLYAEDFVGTGRFKDGGAAQITLELAQAVELGGKRAARVDAATRVRDVATSEYELRRVEVLAKVTSEFIELLAAQSFLAIAKANLDLGEGTLTATADRMRAGAGSALDERKARIEVSRARILVEHAQHQVLSARRELAATWGSDTPSFDRVEGDLYRRRAVPSFETIVARVDTAPEIVRDLAERQLREADVRLADAYRVPTPVVSLGVRRLQESSAEAMVFGLSVPLPFSDRNQGNRTAARALLAKSEDARLATDVRLRTALFALFQELVHAATALDSLEKEILPQAETSLALSRGGFLEGRFTYLDLADAERTLVTLKKERIETAASYHQLVLDIERLTGQPIDGASDKAVQP